MSLTATKAASRNPDQYLDRLGERVRTLRHQRGMTRKALAQHADVSERYLAQLESGEGNCSIVLLRRIAQALGVALPQLVSETPDPSPDAALFAQLMERLPAGTLKEARELVLKHFGGASAAQRRGRVALIGLRGGGKSTLGRQLAEHRGVPFIELDREIEKETGIPGREIFALYGQAGYRRIEKRTLDRVIREHSRAVISVGGGVVSQPESFEMLLSNCLTVWVKATPEEHMARVMAQGDLRPMAGNDEAMDDLKRILEARESLYAKADTVLDTSGESADESFMKLRRLVMS